MIATIIRSVDTRSFEEIEEIRKRWITGGKDALSQQEYEDLKEYDRQQE